MIAVPKHAVLTMRGRIRPARLNSLLSNRVIRSRWHACHAGRERQLEPHRWRAKWAPWLRKGQCGKQCQASPVNARESRRMSIEAWYLLIGALLILVVVANTHIQRWPVSTAIAYLAIGWGLGAAGLIQLDGVRHAKWLEHATELGVIIPLFSAGLKLRLPISDRAWRCPLALAFIAMAVTVGLLSLLGYAALGLPLGAAIILGAVLAPTDPVLASEVQVAKPGDRDQLRFRLTAEAGMNDGTAFPFVMLGLGLLQLHEIGRGGGRWILVDVIWAVLGGIATGAVCGWLVARWIVHLRQTRKSALGGDDFVALGMIALTYGLAVAAHTYGFLAVFAAGVAVRTVERRMTGHEHPLDVRDVPEPISRLAAHPEGAPGYLASAVLQFSEQLERMAELGLVLAAGAMIASTRFDPTAICVALLLLFVIRPVSTVAITAFFKTPRRESLLAAWFGIRGIGSLYYLFYAIDKGLPEPLARQLIGLVLPAVAISVCLHGATAGPLMARYERWQQRKHEQDPGR
jgi:sodium/hydrogen antiporter